MFRQWKKLPCFQIFHSSTGVQCHGRKPFPLTQPKPKKKLFEQEERTKPCRKVVRQKTTIPLKCFTILWILLLSTNIFSYNLKYQYSTNSSHISKHQFLTFQSFQKEKETPQLPIQDNDVIGQSPPNCRNSLGRKKIPKEDGTEQNWNPQVCFLLIVTFSGLGMDAFPFIFPSESCYKHTTLLDDKVTFPWWKETRKFWSLVPRPINAFPCFC